jgi:zinc/manganese transport system substrate-binding protein
VSAKKATATINQWGSLLQDLGGECVKVENVINGTNVDPHDFEINTQQASLLTSADIAIVNGAGYDTWADNLLKDKNVINVADGAGVKEGENPHLWFSPTIVANTASNIHKDLTKLLGSSASSYLDDRYNEWKTKDAELNEAVSSIKAAHPKTNFVASEIVANYLAEDLSFVDKTPSGYEKATDNESEPSAKDLQEFKNVLEKKGARLFFYNKQEESDLTKQLLATAKESGVDVVYVTEQMPEDQNSLLGWLLTITKEVKTLLAK